MIQERQPAASISR